MGGGGRADFSSVDINKFILFSTSSHHPPPPSSLVHSREKDTERGLGSTAVSHNYLLMQFRVTYFDDSKEIIGIYLSQLERSLERERFNLKWRKSMLPSLLHHRIPMQEDDRSVHVVDYVTVLSCHCGTPSKRNGRKMLNVKNRRVSYPERTAYWILNSGQMRIIPKQMWALHKWRLSHWK